MVCSVQLGLVVFCTCLFLVALLSVLFCPLMVSVPGCFCSIVQSLIAWLQCFWCFVHVYVFLLKDLKPHMGSCQNYGPFSGTLNIR